MAVRARVLAPSERAGDVPTPLAPSLVVSLDGMLDVDALVAALDRSGVDHVASDKAVTLKLDAGDRVRGALAPDVVEALDRAVRAWNDGARDLSLADGSRLRLSKRTHVMGIVNVTPDSFSDGGRFYDREAAIAHALEMVDHGADIVDVGGESTRPGAEPVGARAEIERVVPVIEGIRARSDVPISIDTMKAEVARAALDAGATIVNDVAAGRFDHDMLPLCAERGVPVVLMHMLGDPRTMQKHPSYDDVVADIYAFLAERADAAIAAGVRADRIVIDPGFGFGKTREHNLVLLKRLREFTCLGFPVLVGTSRKSFIGLTLDLPVEERMEGTLATLALAVANGAAIGRVHDVAPSRRIAGMVEAVMQATRPGGGGERS